MKVASLFSGAGALDLGLHQAGHEVILLCEADQGARQVLTSAFPGVHITEDVAALERLPEETELLAAGFPCIDVSRAGLRRGLEGKSTGLVRHVFRLLRVAARARRPVPWVLLENVEALLDRANGEPPVMQYIARQFQELGYGSWAYRVVNSAGFGLPNRRRRVFIVASMHGDARDVLLAQGAMGCPGSCKHLFDGQLCYSCYCSSDRSAREVSYAIDLGNAISPAGEDVVPTFTTSNDRMLLLLSSGLSGMLRCDDAERLQGLPEGYTKPCWPLAGPGLGGHRLARPRDVDAETAAAKRWDLLGNAVTVPVARWLGERLAQPYAFKYQTAGVSNRRMDALVREGMADAGPEAGRPSPNLWSFVCLDELQEAVLFPYLLSRPKPAVAGEVEAEGVEAPLPDLTTGDWLDPATNAAREATAEVILAQTEEAGRDRELEKDMFQAALVHRARKGQLSGVARLQIPWDKEAWPRAGWWVRGLGAFAVEDMSEHPVPTPFLPLGDFIGEVGRPARPEEVDSYLHRMQERGWDASNTVAKLLKNNARFSYEVRNISRLPGLLSDADMIGPLCWALDPQSGAWWPVEVLDPMSLPTGRTLPPEALADLSSEQRVASLPSHAASAAMAQQVAPEDKRVLVNYLPVHGAVWQWRHPDDLIPYEANLAAKESAASAAIRSGKFKHAEKLSQALADARASLSILKGRHTLEGDRMRRTRAAAAASAVNLKQRCGGCKTCMNLLAGQRRYECLTQRMKAAALSGHAGAQLAVCREDALGARVRVWWDGDATFYSGVVAHYDAVSTEHTVCYDDGEVGMHKLWQHDERINVESGVEEWPREAEAARQKLRTAHDLLRDKKRVGSPPSAAQLPALGLSDYEQKRAELVRRNRLMFEQTLANGGEAGLEGPGSGESGVAAPGETAVEGPASLAGGASGPSQDWSGGGQRPEAVVSVSLPAGAPVQSAPKRKHSASGKKGGSKKKKAHGGAATCPANGAKAGNALDAEQGPATPTPTQPRRSLCVLCRKTGGTACMVSCVGCAAADVTPPTLSHSTCRGREAARNDEDPLQDWRCPKCRAAQRELGPEHALRGLAEAVLVAA
uniref:DNA (cytosine-5-)-methyltransferase n=3 Tax=Auxenochlorella protothecoides TaxID=3075 RepID=A0A1D2A1D0_AUXPR